MIGEILLLDLLLPVLLLAAAWVMPSVAKPTLPFGVRVPPERVGDPLIVEQRRIYRWWVGAAGTALVVAGLIVGVCLATPYLQDYDLVMSAFVVVWLKQAAGQETRVPAKAVVAAIAAMLFVPFMAASFAKATGLAPAAPFFVAVFALLIALAEAPSKRGATPPIGT